MVWGGLKEVPEHEQVWEIHLMPKPFSEEPEDEEDDAG
jgi:hypothetical protein